MRALLVALVVMVSGTALAAPSDADRAQAGRLYKQAQDLFSAEKYADAIPLWEKANALAPHPSNLYNIAVSYEKLKDGPDCVKGYEAYLALAKQTTGQEARDAADVHVAIERCKALR